MEQGSMIIEGMYLNPSGKKVYGQIKVVDGEITDIGKNIGIADIVYDTDHRGNYLLIVPGFIDIHVHPRDYKIPLIPSREEFDTYERMVAKEDFRSASMAAINGGVVAFGIMPNDPVPPSNPLYLASKTDLAARRCFVDHFLYALVTEESEPFGDVPYKVYTHDFTRKELKDIFRRFNGLSYAPVLTVHCENAKTIKSDPSRPVWAELVDVENVLEFSGEYKVPVHIAHVSSPKSIELIMQARQSGVKVTCETTPFYLYFSQENIPKFARKDFLFAKPPARTEVDRVRLLEHLVRGDIDCLATDHAPHTMDDKVDGAFGIPWLDNYTNFVGWLRQNDVSWKRILDMCCHFPGKWMERYKGERFGRIRQGHVGSFTVVAGMPGGNINNHPVRTKCGWSPFEGAHLGHKKKPGYLLYAYETIIRGVPMKQELEDIVA